jgi:hypothetical protein
MSSSYRPSKPAEYKPCKDCVSFDGWAPVYVAGKLIEGAAANCAHRPPHIQAQPQYGCAYWKPLATPDT